jgi:hypothetical protein
VSPQPGYGDRVEYIPTGEEWTVDAVVAATAYKPERVVLFRVAAAGGVVRSSVLDCSPEQARLICRAAERKLWEGSDWADEAPACSRRDPAQAPGPGKRGGRE